MRRQSWHRSSTRPTSTASRCGSTSSSTTRRKPIRRSRRCRCAGLDEANAYLHRADGTYNDDSGCGNVSNPADPNIQRLVLTALDRFADLGIDGFRFDLASLLNRDDGGLVDRITEWGARARGATDRRAVGPRVVPGGRVAGAVVAMERSLPRRDPRLRSRRARPGVSGDPACAGQP